VVTGFNGEISEKGRKMIEITYNNFITATFDLEKSKWVGPRKYKDFIRMMNTYIPESIFDVSSVYFKDKDGYIGRDAIALSGVRVFGPKLKVTKYKANKIEKLGPGIIV